MPADLICGQIPNLIKESISQLGGFMTEIARSLEDLLLMPLHTRERLRDRVSADQGRSKQLVAHRSGSENKYQHFEKFLPLKRW